MSHFLCSLIFSSSAASQLSNNHANKIVQNIQDVNKTNSNSSPPTTTTLAAVVSEPPKKDPAATTTTTTNGLSTGNGIVTLSSQPPESAPPPAAASPSPSPSSVETNAQPTVATLSKLNQVDGQNDDKDASSILDNNLTQIDSLNSNLAKKRMDSLFHNTSTSSLLSTFKNKDANWHDVSIVKETKFVITEYSLSNLYEVRDALWPLRPV